MNTFLYWITNDQMMVAKAGYHTGSLKDLYGRYVTTYGRLMNVVVFEVDIDLVRIKETRMHKALMAFHYTGELFFKTGFETFCNVCNRLTNAGFICTSSGSPIPRKRGVHTRRPPAAPRALLALNRLFGCPEEELQIKYGIDTIDDDFSALIRKNDNERVGLCMYLVFDNKDLPELDDVLRHKVDLIKEIMTAVGWQHPFDVVHIDGEVAAMNVVQTSLFKNYENEIKYFSSRAARSKAENNQGLMEILKMVMDAIGIKVISKSTQVRNRQHRSRKYAYMIDKASASHIASLINLHNRFDLVAIDDDSQDFLEIAGYGRFKSYVID